MPRYGCDLPHRPYPVTVHTGRAPQLTWYEHAFNCYYLMPPGHPTRGDYTPEIFHFHDSSIRSLRNMVMNSLPPLPISHSIEFFLGNLQTLPEGWSVTSLENMSVVQNQMDGDETISRHTGNTIIISVKVLDEVAGSMVPFDPFPSPTSPPRVLAWTPSCA